MIKSIRIPNGPYFRLDMVGSVSGIDGDDTVVVRDTSSRVLAWIDMSSENLAKQLEETLIEAMEAFEDKDDFEPDWSFMTKE